MEKIKLTEEILKKYVKDGKGATQIAKESGNGRGTVIFLLEKYNLPTTQRNYTTNKVNISKEIVLDLLNKGYKNSEIARKLGCTASYIIRFMDKEGIDYTPYKKAHSQKIQEAKKLKEESIDGRVIYFSQKTASATQHAMEVLLTEEQIACLRSLRSRINSKRAMKDKLTNKALIQMVFNQALAPYLEQEKM